MTDAERLREIAGFIEWDHPTSRNDLRAIADRLEKREPFTKAAEAFCEWGIGKGEPRNPMAACDELYAAYRAMKEAEK